MLVIEKSMDAIEAFEDSDVSDDLDISQHDNDDLFIAESDMIEVHEASSSDDDDIDDNVPLSELAEGPSKETSCSHGKKLTKAQEHAKKYQWKKSDLTVPENTFDGTFSDPSEEVYSPLTYFKILLIMVASDIAQNKQIYMQCKKMVRNVP